MSVVQLHEVHKNFWSPGGTVRVVDGISLQVGAGEVVALLGPNGAGKTTLIDMLLGLTDPTSGTVRLFDGSARDAVTAGRVGAVLQTGGLLRDLTVAETVRAIAALQGVGRRRATAALGQAGLTGIAGRRVSRCSGGEQQRLKFALALLTDPELLVLDEPTTGMDPVARREFWAAMHTQARAGRTIVFATHYLDEAQEFADRVVLVDHGRVSADAPVVEVQRAAGGRHVEAAPPEAAGDVAGLVAALRSCEHVGSVTRDDDGLHVVSTDSDAVVRELLAHGAHDVLVAAPTLESAFLVLTGGN